MQTLGSEHEGEPPGTSDHIGIFMGTKPIPSSRELHVSPENKLSRACYVHELKPITNIADSPKMIILRPRWRKYLKFRLFPHSLQVTHKLLSAHRPYQTEKGQLRDWSATLP